MTTKQLTKIKSVCLYGSVLIVVVSNIFNYFVSYRYLNDANLQWRLAMIAIAAVMFLMSTYMWVNETLKKRKTNILIAGWSALYLLFNLIGVAIGYNLHTKGFMAILFITTITGIGHLCIKLWQK